MSFDDREWLDDSLTRAAHFYELYCRAAALKGEEVCSLLRQLEQHPNRATLLAAVDAARALYQQLLAASGEDVSRQDGGGPSARAARNSRA